MPSVTLTSLVGGGGGFIPTTIIPTTSVASGASGDVITITPPAGKRAALLLLCSQTATTEIGITVSFGGNAVISSKSLIGFNIPITVVNSFKIGLGALNSTAGGGATIDMLVTPLADQVITVTKDAGSTANTILYAYAYGD